MDDSNTIAQAPETSEKKPTQAQLVVDGCKVTLKFSDTPDEYAISEIKKMMMSGLAKA